MIIIGVLSNFNNANFEVDPINGYILLVNVLSVRSFSHFLCEIALIIVLKVSI